MASKVRSSGSLVVQLAQAFGSFALQILVLRALGVDGLAVFAVLYGLLVLSSAVVGGFVGDSLTVLDRGTTPVRAALEWWLVVLSVGTALLAGAGVLVWNAVAGGISGAAACWFVIVSVLFLVEEVGRRWLMAVMRFWSVIAVDVVALLVAVCVVVVVGTQENITLTTFFVAIAIGQLAGVMTTIALLPLDERWLVSVGVADRRAVWEFGRWRAAQQLLRPATLTVVRLQAVFVVGAAAYGRLEAARIFIAPAIHVISGASQYLFADLARDRRAVASRADLVRRTDRRVASLSGAVAAIGLVAIGLSTTLGQVLVGDDVELGVPALVAWLAFASATAASAPYGALASVHGDQRTLTVLRVGEALASVVLVAVVLGAGAGAVSAPWAMAAATIVAAVAVRRHVAAGRTASGPDLVGAPGTISGPGAGAP